MGALLFSRYFPKTSQPKRREALVDIDTVQVGDTFSLMGVSQRVTKVVRNCERKGEDVIILTTPYITCRQWHGNSFIEYQRLR